MNGENAIQQMQAMGIDTRGISPAAMSDPSRLLDTLYQRVVEQEIFEPNYNFILTKIVPKHIVINGIKEFMYSNFTAGDIISAYAAADIKDFEGDGVLLLAELGKADYEFGKKVEIPRQMLFDMFVQPNGVGKVIALIRKSVEYAIEQILENKLWADLLTNVKVIDVEADITTFEGVKTVKQSIASVLKSLGTTTKTSPYIGEAGDGVININYKDEAGVDQVLTIQPPLRWNTQDMIMLKDNKFALAETFNGSTFEIEYEGKTYNVGQVEDFEFDTYHGFDAIERVETDGTTTTVAPAIEIPEGQEIYLFHKDWAQILEFFNTSTLIPKTNKPMDIFTAFEYLGTYFRKDVPGIAFKITAPAVPEGAAAKKATAAKKEA